MYHLTLKQLLVVYFGNDLDFCIRNRIDTCKDLFKDFTELPMSLSTIIEGYFQEESKDFKSRLNFIPEDIIDEFWKQEVTAKVLEILK